MPFELDPTVDLSRAKKVTLGDHEVSIAPLTLRRIIKAAGMQQELSQPSAQDNVEKLIDLVLLGLERTYPSLTREDLLDSDVTIPQLHAVVEVLIEQAVAGKKSAIVMSGDA